MSLFSVGYVLILGVLLSAMWMVGNRDPRAWLVALLARLLLIVWSTLMRVPAIVPVSLAFVVVDWRNYVKWRKERLISDRVAASILGDEDDRGETG